MYHRRCGKKCRAEQAAFVASKGLVEEFERVSEATHRVKRPPHSSYACTVKCMSLPTIDRCVVHDVER